MEISDRCTGRTRSGDYGTSHDLETGELEIGDLKNGDLDIVDL